MAVRDLLHRLARSPDDVRAEHLREWASTMPDTTGISDIRPRERCRAVGVVENVRIDPREGFGSVEATISDGSGEMVAKWLGRPSITGIRLGMGLLVEGTAGIDPEGYLVVLNPRYELIPSPEHG